MTTSDAIAKGAGSAGLRTRRIGRFGWIRDLPDARDLVYSVSLRTLQSLPKAKDLRAQCPPIYDQGRIGSCTANAIAAAIQFDRHRAGQTPDFVPSRLFIYYNERVIEHDVALDRGAQLRDGIKAVARLGVCPETDWPYDDTPPPFDGGPFPEGSMAATKPNADCYAEALEYRAVAYQRLTPTLAQLRGCLAEGLPFVFGFSVYESFFEPGTHRQRVVVPVPSQGEVVLGGHAVMCVGYEDDRQLFLARNSWGPNQGEGGYFYMPYGYLVDPNLSGDFWVIRAISALPEPA
jgi:C1A family cysteine protease